MSMKLSGVAKNAIGRRHTVAERGVGIPSSSRDTDTISDIMRTWRDPKAISQDIQQFLLATYEENPGEEYRVTDLIDAIEEGIKEFRKIANLQ